MFLWLQAFLTSRALSWAFDDSLQGPLTHTQSLIFPRLLLLWCGFPYLNDAFMVGFGNSGKLQPSISSFPNSPF